MNSNLIRIAHGIPVAPLLAALAAEPSLFGEITTRQDLPGSPHKDTEAVFLRWCAGRDVQSAFTDLHTVNYPAFHSLHSKVWPLLDLAYANAGGLELGRAMIVNLKPGGFIPPHADEGAYADRFERFHLALQSGADNFFHVEGENGQTETCHMRPGELWWFNHKAPHWVANQSKEPRLHLIIDMVAPTYRRERVKQTADMECSG